MVAVQINETTRKTLLQQFGYQILDTINQGSFGEVFQAKHHNWPCAVKVIDTSQIDNEEAKQLLPAELRALHIIRHRYVVQVFDIYHFDSQVFVFMEMFPNGDLQKYTSTHPLVPESLAVIWFVQISEAVQHMHERLRAAHRDISMNNILLDKQHNAKLTDFGLVWFAPGSQDIYSIRDGLICGTRPYQSPELISAPWYLPAKADVFALAVVLYAVLCHRFPFHCEPLSEMYAEQTNYPAYIRSRFLECNSDGVKDLLEQMLNPAELHRPTMAQVLKHQWVKPLTSDVARD